MDNQPEDFFVLRISVSKFAANKSKMFYKTELSCSRYLYIYAYIWIYVYLYILRYIIYIYIYYINIYIYVYIYTLWLQTKTTMIGHYTLINS